MVAPPRPGISSAAFTAKPISAARSSSATTKQPKETKASQSMLPMLPGLALGKRPRSPSQSDRVPYVNPRSDNDEWVLESEFLGRPGDRNDDDSGCKGKGKEKETDDKAALANKRQRTARPSQRTDMTSYVLHCPNGRKVLLPSDGMVNVSQLCLEEDNATPDAMPTPPAEPPAPKPLSLLPSGAPKPIGISPFESLPLGELVRLRTRFNFLLTPHNAATELAKVIRLGCPENAAATETGYLVAHTSRLIYGHWYCRRAPLASVSLLWPVNTTLSLPVAQPLQVLALPRKLIVHVGPESGPGAPPPPVLHEEFIGGGLTYFSYSKMDTLEVVLNPWTQTVFTMPGPDVEADNARLEAERQARLKDEKEEKEKEREKKDENETESEHSEDENEGKDTGNECGNEKDERKNEKNDENEKEHQTLDEKSQKQQKQQGKQKANQGPHSFQTVISLRKPSQSEARPASGTKAPIATKTSGEAKVSASTSPPNPLVQKDGQLDKHQPQKHRAGPGLDLPQLRSNTPRPQVPERLPSLRGLLQETDALHAKRRAQLLPEGSTPSSSSSSSSSASSTTSSSHLPQHLHQFLRQAPLLEGENMMIPLADGSHQQNRSSYYDEQLRERHRTYEDRLHQINLQQHEQSRWLRQVQQAGTPQRAQRPPQKQPQRQPAQHCSPALQQHSAQW